MINNASPILIIGMHRSGTAMLSRVLEQAGLFLGCKKEKNNESTFFIKLNDWIIREVGATWATPEAMMDFNRLPQNHMDAILRYLKDQLNSPRAIEYLGLGQYVKYRSVCNHPGVWGWKDPRTTLTLALWLHLFPQAKVINIKRNGIDVAASLRARSKARLDMSVGQYDKYKIPYAIMGKKGKFVDSARTYSLEGCFSLWEHYVDCAASFSQTLRDRYLELTYEAILTSPGEQMERMLRYCELPIDGYLLDSMLAGFDSSRCNAYLNDPELIEFEQSVLNRLALRGYGENVGD